MLNQTLKVVPHGLIQSGQVAISADEKTGLLDFNELIVAGWGPFTKNLANQGELKIDPSLLLSKNIKVGMKWTVGFVTIQIEKANQASVVYLNGEDSASGMADLDLSGDYLKIVHVNMTGTVEGQDIQLELQSGF